MTCEHAAEFISALCDGEAIPRDAAMHLGGCESCKARLADYIQISVEMKRIALLEPREIPVISWQEQRQLRPSWWQIGRQTMRIPRFAFALMVVAIAALSSGLVMVRAKATEDRPVFVFSIGVPGVGAIDNLPYVSDLEKGGGVAATQSLPDSMLAYVLRGIDSRNGAEEIGVRARKFPPDVNRGEAIKEARTAPEQTNWYLAGQAMPIPVPGYESYKITGELLDKIPDQLNPAKQPFEPAEGTLRVMSPAILEDGQLLGSLNGASTDPAEDSAAIFFIPDHGAFLFSLSKFDGASKGTLRNSQLQFESDGHHYLLLAGAPLVAGEQQRGIWVKHVEDFRPIINGSQKPVIFLAQIKKSELPGILGKQ